MYSFEKCSENFKANVYDKPCAEIIKHENQWIYLNQIVCSCFSCMYNYGKY